jgi:hypothetical protein
MIRIALAATAVLAVPLLTAGTAAACSVAGSYRVPTNLELVQRADTIVLATVERDDPAPANGQDLPPSMRMGLIVRPTLLLKGTALPGEIRLRASLSDDPRMVVASNPRDLLNPNPGTLIGGCVRYAFRQGMQLVLFLERDQNGQLQMAGYPFARSAEDVPSPDAPWVKAVRLYVEIAALPEGQRRAALTARRDALRARTDDPDAALLAEDIDRQLHGRRIPPYD